MRAHPIHRLAGVQFVTVPCLLIFCVLWLAYAQAHPWAVSEMVLFSIALSTRSDVEWVTRGVGRYFPAEWRRFRDGVPEGAFSDPPLTTIRKPVPAMGQAAVRTLLEEIGGTPAPHSEFVFMPELVVRGSTASSPGDRNRH